ncbi:hypothetical protein FB451DRAFT_1227305, partial [Mycena latifolia]
MGAAAINNDYVWLLMQRVCSTRGWVLVSRILPFFSPRSYLHAPLPGTDAGCLQEDSGSALEKCFAIGSSARTEMVYFAPLLSRVGAPLVGPDSFLVGRCAENIPCLAVGPSTNRHLPRSARHPCGQGRLSPMGYIRRVGRFLELAQGPIEILLDEDMHSIPQRACDNAECGVIAPKADFRRCFGCSSSHCSTACQKHHWKSPGNHRYHCEEFRAFHQKDPLEIHFRDKAFLRALLHRCYSATRHIFLPNLLTMMRALPGEAPYVLFDFSYPECACSFSIGPVGELEGISSFVSQAHGSGGRIQYEGTRRMHHTTVDFPVALLHCECNKSFAAH